MTLKECYTKETGFDTFTSGDTHYESWLEQRIAELEKEHKVIAYLFECAHCGFTGETYDEICDPNNHHESCFEGLPKEEPKP